MFLKYENVGENMKSGESAGLIMALERCKSSGCLMEISALEILDIKGIFRLYQIGGGPAAETPTTPEMDEAAGQKGAPPLHPFLWERWP